MTFIRPDKGYRTFILTTGYSIYSIDEVQVLEAIAKVYDNNMFVMIPYITERELGVVSQKPFKQSPG